MCADQLTRERHKRKAFLNFSEFQFTIGLWVIFMFYERLLLFYNLKGLDEKINTELFNNDLAVPLLSSLCVLSLFVMVKRKRRLLFHPPTVMNGALGTATCGKSTRHQEWVRKTGWCEHKNSRGRRHAHIKNNICTSESLQENVLRFLAILLTYWGLVFFF